MFRVNDAADMKWYEMEKICAQPIKLYALGPFSWDIYIISFGGWGLGSGYI